MSSVCHAKVVFHMPKSVNRRYVIYRIAVPNHPSLSLSVLTQVGCVDSVDLDAVILIHIVQDRSQTIDVPVLAVFIGQSGTHVGTVDRRHVLDVPPVLPLQVVVVDVRGRCISAGVAEVTELLQAQLPFRDVDLLVPTLFSTDDLANGCRDLYIHLVHIVALLAWLILGRWDYLERRGVNCVSQTIGLQRIFISSPLRVQPCEHPVTRCTACTC